VTQLVHNFQFNWPFLFMVNIILISKKVELGCVRDENFHIHDVMLEFYVVSFPQDIVWYN